MAIDLKQTAIDPGIEIDPTRNTVGALQDALKDMQGNILKSHGRDHSSHLLITFDTETPEHRRKAREFLSGLVESNLITTALQQWEEAKAYRDVQATIHGNGAITDKDAAALLLSASSVFVGVMVSAEGYRALKLDTRYMPDDPSFLAGAKARVDVLQDPPVEDWEDNFTVPLHALVIVADDVADRLESVVTQLKELLQGFCLRVGEETGTAMRLGADGKEDPSAPVREHFGFVDGVSQPLFYARDIDNARTRRGGIDRYDPSAPLDQVLVKDPGGKDTGYGSYFVYRKLEQNVQGFRDDEMVLAKKIAEFAHPKTPTPTPEDIALAGAYMVGRFQDGTPVVERGVAGLGSLPNNFTFDADPDGVRCPFQAHVRKSNPRGDKQRQFGQPLTQERTVRIVRRAISYGKVTLQPGPDDKVGLLFLCAQSSVADQFEFIQNQWANNRNFLREHSGLDPVIGQIQQDQPDDDTLAGHWPKLYGSRNELDFSTNPPSVVGHTFAQRLIGQWVTMKGGEYFFVPSLSALRAYGAVQEAS